MIPLIFIVDGCGGASSTPAPQGSTLVTPTGSYTLSSAAKRLEFARGPYGKHTYMLDFDSSDRLVTWQQVLDESHFNGVRSGCPWK